MKRRRNQRRLSVVWLLLLTVELLCPVLGDEPDFTAESHSPKVNITASIESRDTDSQDSLAPCDYENSGKHSETVCNDECFCHATAIPGHNEVSLKQASVSIEMIAFRYGEPIFTSQPPPYLPPKKS